MARAEGRTFAGKEQKPDLWTWRSIREWLQMRHGGSIAPHELRAAELKWRKIFADCGWSVKGE